MRNDRWIRCPDCGECVKTPDENQLSTPYFVATCAGCGLEFDWRLAQHDFLRGATVSWESYIPRSEVWDHEHCSFCRQTFMEVAAPNVHTEGYVTFLFDDEWWICEGCFEDFREEFGWRVENQKPS
jgi:hypothetical protein